MRLCMDSPASRLARLLSGFILTLLIVVSISIQESGLPSKFDGSSFVPISLFLVAGAILISIIIGRGRPHGEWFMDSWVSRESEEEMITRLERERDESSIHDLGSKWARMEMEHLEAKHSEE